MTTDQWLKFVRRKLADVDTSALRRTDPELLAAADDARLELAVRAVAGFGTMTIGLVKSAPEYGFQGATDDQQVILAYSVAYDVLSATYRQRVDRGDLGISWKSGLEEESSIQAEKAYKQLLTDLANTRDQLLVTYQRQTANLRVQ